MNEQGADYERGFFDGAQHQMKSSVDLALEAMRIKKWVGLTKEDFYGQSELQGLAMKYAEAKLKERNT
jgi:hypothetical protein